MRPALLVIDMQRWFLEVGPPEKLTRVDALIAASNRLIDFFHARTLPVVRILTIHNADRSTWNQWMIERDSPRLIDRTPEAEEHPAVHTCDSDAVIRKTRHSAFIRTDLERVLRDRGVDSVVIAGFATDACIGLTTIDAYERDFSIMLAGDAILGTNPARGEAMLAYLHDRFAIDPMPTSSIIQAASAHVDARVPDATTR